MATFRVQFDLKIYGHIVVSAKNADDAMSQVENESADYLIMQSNIKSEELEVNDVHPMSEAEIDDDLED